MIEAYICILVVFVIVGVVSGELPTIEEVEKDLFNEKRK